MTIQDKIEGMVYAVVGKSDEDRKDFIKLSKSSQDMLIEALIDDIVEGFKALGAK